jgi:hypothetical protein
MNDTTIPHLRTNTGETTMHKTTILASFAAVLLTAGAAMAQEGPNDTASGAAFGNRVPLVQASGVTQGAVQSGTSDIDIRPSNSQWQPGYNINNEGSNG